MTYLKIDYIKDIGDDLPKYISIFVDDQLKIQNQELSENLDFEFVGNELRLEIKNMKSEAFHTKIQYIMLNIIGMISTGFGLKGLLKMNKIYQFQMTGLKSKTNLHIIFDPYTKPFFTQINNK